MTPMFKMSKIFIGQMCVMRNVRAVAALDAFMKLLLPSY